MQPKISKFFKLAVATGSSCNIRGREEETETEATDIGIVDVAVTYTRRAPKPQGVQSQDVGKGVVIDPEMGTVSRIPVGSAGTGCPAKILNKKRSYAQYHLELGQSDFLLHTCSGCGMTYTCGDESDEKLHKVYHRNYHEGIPFKGWHNERQIPMPWTDGQRVILVSDEDPSYQKRKVHDVLKSMERDLGSSKEWLLHKHCKVFLFIRRSRIVACLIAEPIMTAHRVIPSVGSLDEKAGKTAKSTLLNNSYSAPQFAKPDPTVLHFGNATFYRETTEKHSSTATEERTCDGLLLCSEECENAVCGIRAIWVVPSLRRHKIATRLLDAVRSSFVEDAVLETRQCAFSQPTSSGRGFATHYSGTSSFLVY